MTTTESSIALPRPDAGPAAGPSDAAFYDLVEARFRRAIRAQPVFATYVGIHDYDDGWGDGSRQARLDEIEADEAHLAAVEAIDPATLSPEAAFERDLEIHNLRRELFAGREIRLWERRSTAIDTIGDGLFLGFARDFAPLRARLEALTGRLAGVRGYLAEHRTRATIPQVRVWQELEIEAARDLPLFLDEIVAAGRTELSGPDLARLDAAADDARTAVAEYAEVLRASLPDGVDDWALGDDRYDELVELRAFDGLTADDILAIGESQLAEQKAARTAVAREVDPTVDERAVLERIKSDQPASFEAALDLYRAAMLDARRYLIEHGIVTVPGDERLEVVPTPAYLRSVIPFAAYFDTPKFDPRPSGLYVVTPSVGGEAEAMREHNRSSIKNTSIHEAYPGHHLQLAVAARHPSLTRLTTEAPEFVEGWAMYSEQMMREEGFDDGPEARFAMHTDAIWRACRIVLDVKMHRGEIDVDRAAEFLVGHTGFERANARAEVLRYTYTPTYQLSYLLGKVMLLQLREDERRRLGDGFSLRAFHDALLTAGSLPISFHRRALRAVPAEG